MIIRFVAIISLLAASCTTPSTNAEDFYRRAILSLSKKNPSSESISFLTQTLEINPLHSEARLLRAALYRKIGNPALAVEDLTTYLRQNPTDANAFLHRGILHGILGKHAQAEKDFGAAIHLEPYQVEIYMHRGVLYRMLGRTEEAEKDFERARRRGHQLALSFFQKAREEIEGGELDSARKNLTFAIELDPSYSEAYLERGSILAFLGVEKEALADFDQCIKLQPLNPEAYFFRAQIYQNWKLLGDAETDATEATRLAPSSHTYHLLGTILLEKGDSRKAITAFQNALAYATNTNTLQEIKKALQRAEREEKMNQ